MCGRAYACGVCGVWAHVYPSTCAHLHRGQRRALAALFYHSLPTEAESLPDPGAHVFHLGLQPASPGNLNSKCSYLLSHLFSP